MMEISPLYAVQHKKTANTVRGSLLILKHYSKAYASLLINT